MVHKMRADKDIPVWQAALKTAQEQYDACHTRLNALDVERGELVNEMQQLERAIESMKPFTSEHPLDSINKFLEEFTPETDSGLADACRSVLAASQRYMTPLEIRDVLDASKYDLTQHSNPLASIHGILKRFEQSGEVTTMLAFSGKATYKIAPSKRAPSEQDAAIKREYDRLSDLGRPDKPRSGIGSLKKKD